MSIENNANAIQFPLKSDPMFSLVMSDNTLCKGLLERILPSKKIRDLQPCEGSNTRIQKSIITGIISKDVRLDVLFEGDDTWYDVEMQVSSQPSLPLWGRYYASAMDIDQLKQGAAYNNLKHSYVIFICSFDYYGLAQAVYSFQNFDSKNGLPYGDNSFKIVLNTTSPKENTPPELVPFFNYINNMEVPEDDEFIQALHRRVEDFNTLEWRWRLMTLEEQMKLDQEKAFTEGLAEGKAEEKTENVRRMKAEGIALPLISKITGLSIGEIEKV